MKKVKTTLIMCLTSTLLLAQTSPPTSQEVADGVREELSGWIELINYIMLLMIFAGAIYVIGSLISKREASKGVIVSWVIAMIVWAVAYAVYGTRLF